MRKSSGRSAPIRMRNFCPDEQIARGFRPKALTALRKRLGLTQVGFDKTSDPGSSHASFTGAEDDIRSSGPKDYFRPRCSMPASSQ